MIIKSIQGDDDINQMLDSAMCATLNALYTEGLLTIDQTNQFLLEHICVFVDKQGGFKGWLLRFFGKDADSRIAVFKASITKTL